MIKFKQKFKQIYLKAMFDPKGIGILINPYYIIRKGIYEGVYSNKIYLKGKLLDFGCGTKPYKDIIDVEEYIGLDIEESGHTHKMDQIDVYYDGKTIPFEDNYFDSVLTSEVFEHVFNLEEILNEIFRVLKPGGYMVITVPFVWEEHEIPYDFARYTSFGIEHLLKKTGFEIIDKKKSTNYIETIFQMVNVYIFQYVFPKNMFWKTILTPFIITPITIFGVLLSKILPKNKNFYHNNIIVAKKPKK
jgi:SAM-dependent methyltransferase